MAESLRSSKPDGLSSLLVMILIVSGASFVFLLIIIVAIACVRRYGTRQTRDHLFVFLSFFHKGNARVHFCVSLLRINVVTKLLSFISALNLGKRAKLNICEIDIL